MIKKEKNAQIHLTLNDICSIILPMSGNYRAVRVIHLGEMVSYYEFRINARKTKTCAEIQEVHELYCF